MDRRDTTRCLAALALCLAALALRPSEGVRAQGGSPPPAPPQAEPL
ncbi:MAG: hypothetical protein IPH72_18235 [Sandaracinaceae bacterium]|nr:hypothetical protein [Sandaracinaceae bacterium]